MQKIVKAKFEELFPRPKAKRVTRGSIKTKIQSKDTVNTELTRISVLDSDSDGGSKEEDEEDKWGNMKEDQVQEEGAKEGLELVADANIANLEAVLSEDSPTHLSKQLDGVARQKEAKKGTAQPSNSHEEKLSLLHTGCHRFHLCCSKASCPMRN